MLKLSNLGQMKKPEKLSKAFFMENPLIPLKFLKAIPGHISFHKTTSTSNDHTQIICNLALKLISDHGPGCRYTETLNLYVISRDESILKISRLKSVEICTQVESGMNSVLHWNVAFT